MIRRGAIVFFTAETDMGGRPSSVVHARVLEVEPTKVVDCVPYGTLPKAP